MLDDSRAEKKEDTFEQSMTTTVVTVLLIFHTKGSVRSRDAAVGAIPP